jgi:hypothetical protein
MYGIRRSLFAVIAAVLVTAIAGCDPFASFSRVALNRPLTTQDTAFIQPKMTTFMQIVEHLGPPNEVRGTSGGAVAMYYFLDGKQTRINYAAPAQVFQAFVPDLVVSVWGLGVDQLTIWFDDRWVASDYGFAFNTNVGQFRLLPVRQAEN